MMLLLMLKLILAMVVLVAVAVVVVLMMVFPLFLMLGFWCTVANRCGDRLQYHGRY